MAWQIARLANAGDAAQRPLILKAAVARAGRESARPFAGRMATLCELRQLPVWLRLATRPARLGHIRLRGRAVVVTLRRARAISARSVAIDTMRRHAAPYVHNEAGGPDATETLVSDGPLNAKPAAASEMGEQQGPPPVA